MESTDLETFGTLEPAPERRRLRAGPLSAVLEAGQIRDVRWHGVEAARGIAYLLRDAGWGTLPVALSAVEAREDEGAFAVAYEGRAAGPGGRLAYRARIEGRASGRLRFEVAATAETDFVTNRAGFVVLHPDGAAGLPLRVGHADGSVEKTAFPRAISPDQPAFDIVSLEHAPAPGVGCCVAFEGGVWEMEDQRNWADASFKTYVRPLALPRPYVIAAGASERQAVTLTLSGEPRPAAAAAPPPGARPGTVPPLHLRLDEGLPVPDALPLKAPARGLVLRLRVGAAEPQRLRAAAALAARHGLSLMVEALFPQRDPEAEAAACLDALAAHRVEALLVAAERDLSTRPSGSLPEGEAPLDATLAALRRGGFAGRIGTGVPAFFTEFNRNPPPAVDFAFFGACPIVHAADDLSVMETLRVLPAILESAARLRPGVGLWPGPLSLAPAVNPYGPGLAETDGASRTCLAARDPRHGALFGAAHLVGALAATLPRAEALAPLHANGPSGLAGPDGAPLPLAHVHAAIAEAEGAPLAPAPEAAGLAALAWDRGARRTILLANVAAEPLEAPRPPGMERAERLAPGARGWAPVAIDGPSLRLAPYATLRLTGRAAGRA